MYDIAIIGAGPAGATAARLLAEKYRVLLVDRRRLLGPRLARQAEKLCGGLIAPAAQKELARQGLGVPGSVLAGPQLFAVRTLDTAAGLERLYQRHYLNVDRDSFDRWLVSLVPECVDMRLGWSLHSLEADPDGVSLTLSTAAGTCVTARSQVVIGADGAASLVRRLSCPGPHTPTRYVAMQAEFRGVGDVAHYGAIFDRELTDFYGWTVPKGATTLVGLAMRPGRGAVARFDRHVERLRRSGFGLGSEVGRAAAPVVRPLGPADLLLTGGSRTLLIGEAAGLISPSSAEGISYALRSAAAVAQSLEPGIAASAERYRDTALPLVAEVHGKMWKAAVIDGLLMRRAIMASGLGAIPQRGLGGMAGALGELLAP